MRPTVSMGVMMAVILGRSCPCTLERRAPGQQVPLPDGPGREMVQGTCAQCHGLHLITGSFGYTKEGWEDRINTMITLPQDQLHSITAYLATHFPTRPSPAAVMISGPVHVTITEWLAPTLGSRPHDPLAASDGSLWWTGQFANRLGRVDPRSGALKEYPLKNPGVWAARSGRGPRGEHLVHGDQQELHRETRHPDRGHYRISNRDDRPACPRPAHTDLRPKGTLWFTMQSGHVGRLSAATGEMKIVAAPSGAGTAYPYGIQVNSQGVPWYVDFRGNRIASIEPSTMAIKEIALPNADARPRRIAITATTLCGTPTSRGVHRPVRSEDRRAPRVAVPWRQGTPSPTASRPWET